jgi:NAD(P)H-flavin reductase
MNVATNASPSRNCWLPQTAHIRSIRAETPGVSTYELELDGRSGGGFRFAPGQFNMLYVPGFGEAAISISSSPHTTGALAHTVREVGDVTGALARQKPGGQIALRGPFGTPWPVDAARGGDVILVAGGIGLAPLRPVVYHVVKRRGDYGRVRLIYGARTPRDLLYEREFDAWRRAGIELETTVDRGDPSWKGHIGVATELMRGDRAPQDRTSLFTCGPEIMMRFVAREATALGIDAERMFVSLERNMNCAVGMCGHCQLGGEFICKDGPVFPYSRIERYMRLEDL